MTLKSVSEDDQPFNAASQWQLGKNTSWEIADPEPVPGSIDDLLFSIIWIPLSPHT